MFTFFSLEGYLAERTHSPHTNFISYTLMNKFSLEYRLFWLGCSKGMHFNEFPQNQPW